LSTYDNSRGRVSYGKLVHFGDKGIKEDIDKDKDVKRS